VTFLTNKIQPKYCQRSIQVTEKNSIAPERLKYGFLLCFAAVLGISAFFFNSPEEILEGSKIIISSSANLLTDYFQLANIGATLINASLMSFLTIGIMVFARVPITGTLIAATFTVAGFSMFGKNLYNSIPIMLGVILYSRISRVPFKNNLSPAFFGTALAPLVSEITFNLDLPLYTGIPLGVLAGIVVGLIIPPMACHFVKFHQGCNLYNIGFTTGIIGISFIALFRTFAVKIEVISLVSGGNNHRFVFLLYGGFLAMFLVGLQCNKWSFKGFVELLRESGRGAPDFISIAGFGLTLINMAFLGIITTTYVLVTGGEINGPTIGGILTVVGFGACGKHIKNVPPVMLGVYIMGRLNIYDHSATPAQLAALFGTTLAPISGRYGPVAGVIAGALHMALVTNITDLHAGMNLYHNGFSGGLVAGVLVPIFNHVKALREAAASKKKVAQE